MSFLIGQVPLQSFKLGTGQLPKGVAIGDYTKLNKAPSSVTFNINWANYGGAVGASCLVELDISVLGASNPLDKIRSIIIDNSFSDQDVFAYLPDTQQTIIAPANSIVISPVWTNGLKVQVFASGFLNFTVPSTSFILSNVPKSSSNSITSASFLRKSIYQPTTIVGPNGGNSTKNYAPFMGNFSPFSTQWFLIYGERSAAGVVQLNSLTVNGVAQTIVMNSPATTRDCFALVRCVSNFSGQTPAVAAVFSQTISDNYLAVLTAYNLSNGAALFNSFGPVSVAGGVVSNLLTPSEGIAIAAAIRDATPNQLIIGIQNINSGNINNGGYSYGYQLTNGGPLAISMQSGGRMFGISVN